MLGEFDELVQWPLKATRCKVKTLVITFTASATAKGLTTLLSPTKQERN